MGLQEQGPHRPHELAVPEKICPRCPRDEGSVRPESLMEHAVEGNHQKNHKVPRMPNLPTNGSTALLETRTKSRVAMHEDLMRARLAASGVKSPVPQRLKVRSISSIKVRTTMRK